VSAQKPPQRPLWTAQKRTRSRVDVGQSQLASERFVENLGVGPLFGIGLSAPAAVAATTCDDESGSENQGQYGGGAAEAAPPAEALC
jgi:hypothetical protein